MKVESDDERHFTMASVFNKRAARVERRPPLVLP
jgi:hypothetical protein